MTTFLHRQKIHYPRHRINGVCAIPGKITHRFEEKYTRGAIPQRYAETAAKVIGVRQKTPAGTHRPIMVADILPRIARAPNPGELAVDCTLGFAAVVTP